MLNRPRRLRANALLREAVHETDLKLAHLIQPYFLAHDRGAQEPIRGFSGVFRWGIETLKTQIEKDLEKGLQQFLLFGQATQNQKDAEGSSALEKNAEVVRAIQSLKKAFGDDILLFSDVCLCPYTSHGHCGVVRDGQVKNDESIQILAQVALQHAEAGVDFVAPSDMMDGRVAAIRKLLDEQGLLETGILSYTAKYASSYYGPFREALDSSPQAVSDALKDRSTYQMDFRNSAEALRELQLDLQEGADLVMVKPALAYLDIISSFRKNSSVPVVAYSVSAEYEMVKSIVEKGLAEERALVIENLTAIRRAGAQLVVTYHATDIAQKGWFK